MKFRTDCLAIAFLALAGIAGCPFRHARAQSLEISPISIELQPGQTTTTLAVTNWGSDPTVLQMRPFQWGEVNGAEQLTPTEQLLVSPPITNVPAGETQTFRIVLERPAETTEGSYRLLLDQLPAAALAGAVRIALRISIPIFAEPEAAVYPDLVWQIEAADKDDVLVAINHGSKHVRILNPVLVEPSGRRFELKRGQTPYILPGAERRWPISQAGRLTPGSMLHLLAKSDAGPIDAAVYVSEP